MFRKVEFLFKRKMVKSKNDALHASLFRFLREDDQNRMSFYSSTNIDYLENGKFSASSDDPSFLIQLPFGQKAISVLLQIQSKNTDGSSAIYYSHDKRHNFSEKRKIIIGKTDGQLHEKHLLFSDPIYWLRVDPVDQADELDVLRFDIHVTADDIASSNQEFIERYHELSFMEAAQLIREKVHGQTWKRDDVLFFITHEVSGTGAPLLCRKMSAQARHLGKHTVILSLSQTNDYQTIRQFKNDCDVLLISRQIEDLILFLKELNGLGLRFAILNSVASGLALRHFHNAGFMTVCLIHEMNSALQILNAQKWIKDYSTNADKVIFPANCVKDEFIRFGGEINDKSIVMPQGYYKRSESFAPIFSRKEFMRRLKISDDAKLIIGAGSINFLKGIDLLPLIACELRRMSDVEYHFVWLGETNDMQYNFGLQNQIMRMNLTKNFHFLGYIADEYEYLSIFCMCDALALVSREDSYPSVMIEAMACEVPVVAFKKSGGADDLLADGRGLLIDYMDIHQYAQVLHDICIEPGYADDVKECAKEYIISYGNFKQYVKNILALFM